VMQKYNISASHLLNTDWLTEHWRAADVEFPQHALHSDDFAEVSSRPLVAALRGRQEVHGRGLGASALQPTLNRAPEI